jgi:hypothetical protein
MTASAPAPALAPGRRPLLSVLPAALIALGLVGAGALVGAGIPRLRTADRTVSVKGVAEREARADLAIWPLRLVATDDDLAAANAQLARSAAEVRRFLAAQGLAASDAGGTQVTVQDFTVTDARTNQGSFAPGSRFVIRETIVVRSTDVARVQAAAQRVADLVQAGVVLSSGQEYGGGGPTFLFTKLDALKAPMIAEATAQARRAAEQFARDSKSGLGGIRSATQGYFEILPRDQAPGISQESQLVKTVRVVTTVAYGLRD